MEQAVSKRSRRSVLKLAGSAVVAGYIAGEAVNALSPQDRLDNAVAELRAAAQALWPEINDWRVVTATTGCPVLIAAWTPAGYSNEPVA